MLPIAEVRISVIGYVNCAIQCRKAWWQFENFECLNVKPYRPYFCSRNELCTNVSESETISSAHCILTNCLCFCIFFSFSGYNGCHHMHYLTGYFTKYHDYFYLWPSAFLNILLFQLCLLLCFNRPVLFSDIEAQGFVQIYLTSSGNCKTIWQICTLMLS